MRAVNFRRERAIRTASRAEWVRKIPPEPPTSPKPRIFNDFTWAVAGRSVGGRVIPPPRHNALIYLRLGGLGGLGGICLFIRFAPPQEVDAPLISRLRWNDFNANLAGEGRESPEMPRQSA